LGGVAGLDGLGKFGWPVARMAGSGGNGTVGGAEQGHHTGADFLGHAISLAAKMAWPRCLARLTRLAVGRVADGRGGSICCFRVVSSSGVQSKIHESLRG
jgi:hypothetical protein